MNITIADIRKVCIFLMLLSLNIQFIFVNEGYLNEEFQSPPLILVASALLFGLLSFNYTALSKEHLVIMGLVLFVSVIEFSFRKSNVFFIFLLMQGIYFIDTKLYLKFNVIIMGITAIVLYVMYGTGDVGTSHDHIDAFIIRDRHSFHMGHPNGAAMYYYGLIISALLLLSISKYKKYMIIWYAISFLLAYYIYSYTQSRSFLVAVITIAIVLAYYSLRKYLFRNYKLNISKYLLFILPVLFTITSILLGVYSEQIPLINVALSGRPTLYKEFLDMVSFPDFIFGTIAIRDIIIDNLYIHLLFDIGIILFAYFIWLYWKAMKNIIRQQNFLIIAILVSILTYGLMESAFLYPLIIGCNFLWVILFKYRYGIDETFDPHMETTSNDENKIGY